MLTTYPNTSRLLDTIMFADDANHKDIKHLFTVVNNELINIEDWLTGNKLSLNVEKNKHSSISQGRKTISLLRLAKVTINNYEIQREKSIKFLEVLLDQDLT